MADLYCSVTKLHTTSVGKTKDIIHGVVWELSVFSSVGVIVSSSCCCSGFVSSCSLFVGSRSFVSLGGSASSPSVGGSHNYIT